MLQADSQEDVAQAFYRGGAEEIVGQINRKPGRVGVELIDQGASVHRRNHAYEFFNLIVSQHVLLRYLYERRRRAVRLTLLTQPVEQRALTSHIGPIPNDLNDAIMNHRRERLIPWQDSPRRLNR